MNSEWNHGTPGGFLYAYCLRVNHRELAGDISSLVYSRATRAWYWESPNGAIERALTDVPETL